MKENEKKISNGVKVLKILTVVFVVAAVISTASKVSSNLKSNTVDNSAVVENDTNSDYRKFLDDLSDYVASMDSSTDLENAKLDFAEEVESLQTKYQDGVGVDYLANSILTNSLASFYNSTGDFINSMAFSLSSLLESVKGLFGGSSNLVPAKQGIKIQSTRTGKFISATKADKTSKYNVELNALTYLAKDNGGSNSNNWVVLVHGNKMSGSAMAKAVGAMYLENNVNVLAIDLRGAGDSKGKVAMGFLEALDLYDWIDDLNSNPSKYGASKKPTNILIHGVSLGGATTLQSLTLGGLNIEGIGTMPTLSSMGVVGLVDDCGYTSMTGIIKSILPTSNKSSDKNAFQKALESLGFGSSIIDKLKPSSDASAVSNGTGSGIDALLRKALLLDAFNTGLSDNNFDLYQDAFNSNRKIDTGISQMLIIHGTKDTIVKPENSVVAYNNIKKVGLSVEKWDVEGQPHAFIVAGMNKDDYTSHIKKFINTSIPGSTGSSSDSDSKETCGWIQKMFGGC